MMPLAAEGLNSARMPASTQKQARFMGAVAGGAIKKPGLSPAKAKEFVRGQNIKSLPTAAQYKKEKVGKK